MEFLVSLSSSSHLYLTHHLFQCIFIKDLRIKELKKKYIKTVL